MNPELPALLKPKEQLTTKAESVVDIATLPYFPARGEVQHEGKESLELPDSQDFDTIVDRFLGPERQKFLEENRGDYQKLMRWQAEELERMNEELFFNWDASERDAHKLVGLVRGYNALDEYSTDGCSDEELMYQQESEGHIGDGYGKFEQTLRSQVLAQLLDSDRDWQLELTAEGMNYRQETLYILRNLHLWGGSQGARRGQFNALVERIVSSNDSPCEMQAAFLCGARNFSDWNPLSLRGADWDEYDIQARDRALLSVVRNHKAIETVLRIAEDVLKTCDLPAEEMLHWWNEPHITKEGEQSKDEIRAHRRKAVENIDTILTLLRDDPALPKKIYDQTHIMNFDQYSINQLERQVNPEWLASRTMLYPVILPRSDHNGAFHTESVMGELVGRVNEVTDSALVFEADSRRDIIRALLTMQKNCPNAKIKTLFLGGHGQSDRTDFGRAAYKNILVDSPELKGSNDGLRQKDVQFLESKFPRLVEFLRSMMAPEANIVLVSCSTGQEYGLAQDISKLLGVEVTAPTFPTHIDLKTLQKRPNGTFSIQYFKDKEGSDPTIQYYAGQAQ